MCSYWGTDEDEENPDLIGAKERELIEKGCLTAGFFHFEISQTINSIPKNDPVQTRMPRRTSPICSPKHLHEIMRLWPHQDVIIWELKGGHGVLISSFLKLYLVQYIQYIRRQLLHASMHKDIQYVQEQWTMIDTFKETCIHLHPVLNPHWKLTWQWKSTIWRSFPLLQMVIFPCHVSFQVYIYLHLYLSYMYVCYWCQLFLVSFAYHCAQLGMASFHRAKQNREIATAADKMAGLIAPGFECSYVTMSYFSLGCKYELCAACFTSEIWFTWIQPLPTHLTPCRLRSTMRWRRPTISIWNCWNSCKMQQKWGPGGCQRLLHSQYLHNMKLSPRRKSKWIYEKLCQFSKKTKEICFLKTRIMTDSEPLEKMRSKFFNISESTKSGGMAKLLDIGHWK